ncbi:MAG: hypothetical protein ACT4QF_18270 [Sporichthyaceae bacterium]
MTPGRSNGLPAVRYTPLVDLEPHFADALLEALRQEGVAAYAAPAPGRRGPYLDIQLPDRPTDRVFVDSTEHGKARQVLRELPELAETAAPATPAAPPAAPRSLLTDAESDAAWRAIVAGYATTTNDPVPPWPVSEDAPADSEPPKAEPATAADDSGWDDLKPASVDVEDSPADDPEDHYVPPPPPPLPRLAPRTKLAWLGVAAGPAYLFSSEVFGQTLFYGAGLLAFCASFGGAAAVIYRMRDDRNEQIGGDDGNGAVV